MLSRPAHHLVDIPGSFDTPFITVLVRIPEVNAIRRVVVDVIGVARIDRRRTQLQIAFQTVFVCEPTVEYFPSTTKYQVDVARQYPVPRPPFEPVLGV
ncbi:MAG: hypothetical protein BGN97_08200 [Microbacterium sp. 69-10]|nr:MAG: hypothetical protein BGN97_08200 [Microbacterium sp. 69-10]